MLELFHLSKSYKNKKVLEDINFIFNKKNNIYTILGASGAGKTTIFNILYGIDQEYNGEYYIDDKLVRDFNTSDWDKIRNKKIGIVFQDYKLLENSTVTENLDFSCFLPENKKDRINEILKLMNLEDVKNLKVSKLSGGQKQRLAIGRAIINKPEILLFDEPTGNLDDTNVKSIMKYISFIKKDTIIIIITHDKRIEKYSDTVLKLKSKKLLVEKDNNVKNKDKIDSNEYINYAKPNVFKYFILSFRNRIKDLILNNIPICIIISIFICIFSLIQLNYKSQLDLLYNGLSERAIYISSSNFSDKYIKNNNEQKLNKSDDGTRIAFSLDDLKNVKRIAQVKDARLYNSSNISMYDNDQDKLSLLWEKEKMSNYIKEQPSYSSAPDNIIFQFNSMNIPHDFSQDFNKVPLITGDYPEENTNQIVIPDILAYSYCNSINECLKKEIKFNTYNQKSEYKDKKYLVVGVYKTNFEKYVEAEYPVYVNYIEYDFLDLFLNEKQYHSMKKMDLENNQTVKNYNNHIYDTYESYSKAIGTNLGDMIVIVDQKENVKDVQLELQKLFPNLKIISQYEMKHGELSLAYKQTENYIFIGTLGIVSILGIIIIFLTKSYIKTRNKELAILYAIGYSKFNTSLLIFLEYFVTTIFNVAFAYFILKILEVCYFANSANYELFEMIFNSNYIYQISLYVVIMILFSVIFSLYGINKKKLRKYLEG